MNYADNPQAYLTEWDTTTIPTIAAGKSFYIGGAAYRSSGTGAIGGTVPSSDGTYYLKVVLSTMAVEWETSAAAYSWSESNGGWYNSTTAMLLPVFVVRYSSGNYAKLTWIDERNAGILSLLRKLDLNIGDNADSEINFAADAKMLWDESENSFFINKPIKAHLLTNGTDSVDNNAITEEDLYNLMSPAFPYDGAAILLSGAFEIPSSYTVIASFAAINTSSEAITLHGFGVATGSFLSHVVQKSDTTTTIACSLAW